MGTAAASGSWYDQVTVVNTTTGQTLASTTVYYDASAAGSGPVAAGGSVARQASFTLPDGGAVLATPDHGYYGLLPPGLAIRRQRQSRLWQPGNGNLHFCGGSLSGSPGRQPRGGQCLVVAIRRRGHCGLERQQRRHGPASGTWYDQVTVVNTTTGQTLASGSVTRSSDGGSLGAGPAEARQFTFTLPDGTAGVGQLAITITADAGGNLLEFHQDGTPDNHRSTSITAQFDPRRLSGYCCLRGPAPATALPGQQITVSWTVSNLGMRRPSAPGRSKCCLPTMPPARMPSCWAQRLIRGPWRPASRRPSA